MPRRVGQRFVYSDAGETESTTSLTACREFRGESTLTFGTAASSAGSEGAVKAADSASLPEGVRFEMALTTPLAADTAAAGDPFSGKLTQKAVDASGKERAPKGSEVEGRLLRVQSFANPPETVFVLRPEAVWVRGKRVSLHAVRDWVYLAQHTKVGKSVEVPLPLRGEEGAGAFRFAGEHVVVRAGERSGWKTTAPR